jgi:hypothetical protein
MEIGTDKIGTMCAECVAAMVDGMTCWEQLGSILAWEWNDPELAAKHFLTVASYNLQHPAQFTSEALAGLRASYIEHLDHGTRVEDLRRRASTTYEGKKRVLRPEAERWPVLRTWSITIADVYIPERPQGAASRVTAWAAAVRSEL